MAKEIKSINVAPSSEEATINFWQIWGWELKSTQEIKTQDVQTYTGQSSDGSTRYYETKPGEHYIKLTFEREKSMPNYAELCELEQKYDSIYFPEEPTAPFEPYSPVQEKPGCKTWGCSAPAVVIGVIMFGLGGERLITGGVLTIVGIAIFVTSMILIKKTYSEKLAEWENEYAEWEKEHANWKIKHNDWQKEYNDASKRRREIIERAKSLLV